MAVQLLQPKMLLLFFPLAILAYLLIKKKFISLPEDLEDQKRKARWRRWIFISRLMIIAMLVIALAQPYGEVTRDVSGNPRLTILIDNSSSMGIFDTSFVPELLENLKEEIPVTVRTMGGGERSDIGESVLANLEQGKNLLLITDGYNTAGANLGDVSLFASQTNSTLSAIDMMPANADVGVSILGPEKLIADLNTTFLISVTKPGIDFYHITVTVDGKPIIDADTDKNVIYLDQTFSRKGYHTIKAEVTMQGNDFFAQNNVFYKTVNVIEKPKILYVTEKSSPLEVILQELYEVTKVSSLPSNIEPYYAIIVNDVGSEKFRNQDALSEYLIEGNGLVVFGGFNSFDRGNYKNSIFEQLLPVRVGAAERKFSDNTVVIAIDRSHGGGKCRTIIDTVAKTKREVCGELAYIDVIKAQALELLNQFDPSNRVGVVAFDTGNYLIEPIDFLYNNKDQMTEKIKRIQPGADALVSRGIQGGYNLLSNEKGNKYLILLTDGITWQGDQEESMGLAGNLYKQGITLITVGIGRSIYEDFLKSAAANGGGFYISADNKGKLKVLFGDPEKREQDSDFPLFVVNTGHFITRNMEPTAVMQGFNQVLPKSSAELLITTDGGEPALTVWRYGLGKVATWNVFSGGNLGQLLNAQNSLVLTRTVNWAIGDPERKKEYFVDVEDGRIGETLKVRVKSGKIPSAEGLQFIKTEENMYEASLKAEETGFGSILESQYAVNYPKEYEQTGFNPQLPNIVGATGGKLFKASEVESIVDFVKSVSRRTVTEKTTIVWPFVLGAILLFLIEVMMRRISENRRLSR